jgi:hypothetical protein
MSVINRQAALGAFVATALMLGAGAGPAGGVPSAAPTHGVLNAAPWVFVTSVARSCGDIVIDNALDAAGEVAARLKQI